MVGTLFGFKGRLTRAGYIEALLGIILFDALALVGALYIHDFGLPGGYGPASALTVALVRWAPLAVTVLTVWMLAATSVKRAHDRSRSGWLMILLALPVLGWLWLVVDLLLLGSAKGRNRHGAPVFGNPGAHGAHAGAAGLAAAVAGHDAVHDHAAPHHYPDELDRILAGGADHAAHDDHGHADAPARAAEVHAAHSDDHGSHDDHAELAAESAHADHAEDHAVEESHAHPAREIAHIVHEDHDDEGHDSHGRAVHHDHHHHEPVHA